MKRIGIVLVLSCLVGCGTSVPRTAPAPFISLEVGPNTINVRKFNDGFTTCYLATGLGMAMSCVRVVP